MTRFSRLLPRIYAVSLLQLVAIACLSAVVGWLTFRPDPEIEGRAKYVLQTIAAAAGDPARFQRELDRARAYVGIQISVYGPDDVLVATNTQPALVGPHATLPPSFPLPWVVPFLAPVLEPDELPILRVELNSPLLPGAYLLCRPPKLFTPASGLGVSLLVIVLGATALASVWLTRSLARPILQLTTAAKRFGAGDLHARSDLARGDEFGELSATFDQMADRVMQLMRSRQELLANVSHELRTPLARIRVALDLATEDGSRDSVLRELLGEIAEDCGELERLVGDVLQLARLEMLSRTTRLLEHPLHLEPVDTGDLVQRAAERFRAAHPQRALELHCAADLPVMLGDPVLLRRVLDNLLDNARKYSPSGEPVVLWAQVAGPELRIAVEDRGMGIAPEELSQVGTPFFRTDRSRTRQTGGVGLGLSLSRKIVSAHGGSLEIESELNKGTRVQIRLPTVPAQQDASAFLH